MEEVRLHYVELLSTKEPSQGEDFAGKGKQMGTAREVEVGGMDWDRLRPEAVYQSAIVAVEHHGNIVVTAVA